MLNDTPPFLEFMDLGSRKLAESVSHRGWNFAGVIFSTIGINEANMQRRVEKRGRIRYASRDDTEAQLYFYTYIFITNFPFSLS